MTGSISETETHQIDREFGGRQTFVRRAIGRFVLGVTPVKIIKKIIRKDSKQAFWRPGDRLTASTIFDPNPSYSAEEATESFEEQRHRFLYDSDGGSWCASPNYESPWQSE